MSVKVAFGLPIVLVSVLQRPMGESFESFKFAFLVSSGPWAKRQGRCLRGLNKLSDHIRRPVRPRRRPKTESAEEGESREGITPRTGKTLSW